MRASNESQGLAEAISPLTDFLLARLAEDEEVAKACLHQRWSEGVIRSGSPGRWVGIESEAVLESLKPFDPRIAGDEVARSDSHAVTAHIARQDPARVLAECAAKRLIVTACEQTAHYTVTDGLEAWAASRSCDFTLRKLAAIYRDHLDYREEWA